MHVLQRFLGNEGQGESYGCSLPALACLPHPDIVFCGESDVFQVLEKVGQHAVMRNAIDVDIEVTLARAAATQGGIRALHGMPAAPDGENFSVDGMDGFGITL